MSTAKRQRLTPTNEPAHVSDLSFRDSQSQMVLLQQEVRQMRDEGEAKVKALEGRLQETQKRLQDNIDALAKLQYRHETRHKQYHDLKKEHARSVETITAGEEKRTTQIATIAQLKQDKIDLTKELEAAREALKGTPGHVAELELAREKTRAVEKEKEALEKRISRLESDYSFVSEQYRSGSTTALENSRRISELEEENAELKKKASGEAVRLSELRSKSESQTSRERIAFLEATLANREEMLRKKEEELRTKVRGVATRSSSVQPRSPRIAPRGDVSRGSSPAPSAVPRGSGLRFGENFH